MSLANKTLRTILEEGSFQGSKLNGKIPNPVFQT